MSREDLKTLVESMEHKKFYAGEIIYTFGEPGEQYYIIKKGKVQMTFYHEGTDPEAEDLPKHVAFKKFVTVGDGFGKLSLMQTESRISTN